MTSQNLDRKGVRYIGFRVDATNFPACDEIPIEFPTAAGLEDFLSNEWNRVLTDDVCPCCGTRLVEMRRVVPIPADMDGLLGCLNGACETYTKVYTLPEVGGQARKVTQPEMKSAVEAARKRGKAVFGLS